MAFKVAIVGAGLAGSEAALQIATLLGNACRITLFEMRPHVTTPAHETSECAELVCSNSFKSVRLDTPHGCIKSMLGGQSFLLAAAQASRVAAGDSLAVDRQRFSRIVSHLIDETPEVQRKTEEVHSIPSGFDAILLAPGPLCSPKLAQHLREAMGRKSLYFYDAIAPIVSLESLDTREMFFKNRYSHDQPDFLNIPLTETQYFEFVNDLKTAEKVDPAPFEKPRYFESCLPIEVLAERGPLTLSFGPMSPKGLRHPETGAYAYAVIQLRREDPWGQSFNMVGFQTRMRYPEQIRVFRKLPGMQSAEFLRLGSIHRNTYIHAPSQLLPTLQWKWNRSVFFAGQITGAEGYTEAITTGLIAGRNIVNFLRGQPLYHGNSQELIGGLLLHLTRSLEYKERFEPLNFNYGLMDCTDVPHSIRRDRSAKRLFLAQKSLEAFQRTPLFWMGVERQISQRSSEINETNL